MLIVILHLIAGERIRSSGCHCGFQAAAVSLQYLILFVITFVVDRVLLCSPYCPFLLWLLLCITHVAL